jgi:hypothetical protein
MGYSHVLVIWVSQSNWAEYLANNGWLWAAAQVLLYPIIAGFNASIILPAA